ncbi:hypothetical protein [Siphonobacter sp. SORGH_AS_1065]|uniref:hypothetical protein n=1 Tax=Siphonobacter sp. SORGH_AS_1065 TaxID=3041795 RepID=UPI00278A01CB|nr:hypothetical protein [Siphonobacter sp. SORGH_AS_1065]MDQ1085619.1 hypothetical protein [Siphonobacter sp. SORGH_AS_1065]
MLKSTYLSFIIIGIMILSSCRKTETIEPDVQYSDKLTYDQLEENRIIFSKTLAKALDNVEVRSLIKNEALKKFDKDTEILYQMIKDNRIGNETFESYLTKIYGSSEFIKIVNSLPLLTISIPHLSKFSAESWNIESEIPLVSPRPNKVNGIKRANTVQSYNGKGFAGILKTYEHPTVPVIVVKDNERVILQKNAGGRMSDNQAKAFSNASHDFVFWDKDFDGKIPDISSGGRGGVYSYFDSRARFAYENNLEFHRDYIYYGIAPELGINTGTLNTNYQEHITSLKFHLASTASTIFDDPVSDWGDGNFEFSVGIYFISDKTSLSTLQKGFNAALGDLFKYTVDSNGNIIVSETKQYIIPNKGIPIATWDMARFGDTWKISLQEIDAQTTQTYNHTYTITSNFGTNFTSNVKEGPNFGSTTANGTSFSQSYTLAITGGSDFLYEGFLTWKNKVIVNRYDVPISLLGNIYHIDYGNTHDIDTGMALITIEPKPIY